MLINLSNHPSANWKQEQVEAAKKYGRVHDMDFPQIDPEAGSLQVAQLADQYEQKVRQLLAQENTGASAVHLMGELTFCFALVARLQKAGITCLASTSRRDTVENGDGSKTSVFRFVRFRDYPHFSQLIGT